jgi:hypothetical protein
MGPARWRSTTSAASGDPAAGTLKVDGKDVATKKMERTLPMILQWDESFDIGSDTLTGVNDADYKPPFTLTAKLNKLTIKVDRPSCRRRHPEAAGGDEREGEGRLTEQGRARNAGSAEVIGG